MILDTCFLLCPYRHSHVPIASLKQTPFHTTINLCLREQHNREKRRAQSFPNPVHVIVKPDDIKGYSLLKESDFLPEDITTVSKNKVCATMGYIPRNAEIMNQINYVLAKQLGLLSVVGAKGKEENDGR